MFQMFLTTFMRKMATGRVTTTVLAVFTVFFGRLAGSELTSPIPCSEFEIAI
jgi:hypothetical protein